MESFSTGGSTNKTNQQAADLSLEQARRFLRPRPSQPPIRRGDFDQRRESHMNRFIGNLRIATAVVCFVFLMTASGLWVRSQEMPGMKMPAPQKKRTSTRKK